MTDTVINRGHGMARSIMKLERHQRSIFKYLEKLKSYRCEPTDYSCFIMVRKLKDGLTSLALDQKLLLDIVRDKSNFKLEQARKIESCEKRYHQLEVDMAAYLSQINNHY
ncbi:hypothetical protein [Allomuricauda sp. d1]|uniref:hypothetical protein n=1 Tax=Allomuricauda sp. d1 TaxID=3136725 RepID=UPI0031E31A78